MSVYFAFAKTNSSNNKKQSNKKNRVGICEWGLGCWSVKAQTPKYHVLRINKTQVHPKSFTEIVGLLYPP